MVKLSELIDLHTAFKSEYGPADDLVSYLARPRVFTKNYDYLTARRALMDRTPKDSVPQIGWIPQDQNLMLLRFDLLANNNKAYRIAMQKSPNHDELEDFGNIKPCWSTLFSVKSFLMDHPDVAKKYRGFLPFGSEVSKYANTLLSRPRKLPLASHNLRDHVWLKDISNEMSDFLGIPTVEVNNIMYLKGLGIVS
jgi:hypothetical protein